jgi:hypothetical protein
MKWSVGLLLLILSQAEPVRASEPLVIPLAVYATAAAADLHSTYNFLQYEGFEEGNPMGRWLSNRPKTLIVSGALADVGIVWGLHKLLHRKGKGHSKWEKAALYGAATVRLMLARNNYEMVQGQPRKRR